MYRRRLLDVWLKLEWAKHHSAALTDEIQRWCDAQSHRLTAWTFTQKFDKDRQCIVMSLDTVELSANWMLMLGDVVYAGAEMATAYGQATGPDPRAKMNLKGSIGIAINPGLWLWDALVKIGEFITLLNARYMILARDSRGTRQPHNARPRQRAEVDDYGPPLTQT